ncbi:hypothetical protein [Gilliamella sp. Pas-s25]|uniref:hypothetical protein n=1 Tax=Gilliamella sp. Pas-s25 TaxID=2687310 RepID=UPI00135DC042|nr:hypothetical protein [Gilliamella sp. Pas-s25]MWP63092.1 hypothetical protein [Gilliamella sp. Pas-s25]
MKSKVAVAVLLSTSLVSLNSAASGAMALSSQYQTKSEINHEDIKMINLKNKVINYFNIDLVKTLKDSENILYEITDDFSCDFIKNYDFSAMLKNLVSVESSAFTFINNNLITKMDIKDSLRLILSLKNKITRIMQIRDSLDVVPTYYNSGINTTHILSLANNTTNKLLSEIKNKA